MISVIIPALNEEHYITSCLSAITSQSDDNYELIVVDGGSTDRTGELAEKFADKIIGPIKPVGAARNAGARIAKGEILAFIDADTVTSPNWLESITKSMDGGGDIVGASGPVLPLDGNGFDRAVYGITTNQILKATLAINLPMVPGCNCAYKRDVFLKVGGFDEDRILSEDMSLSLKVRREGRIAYNKHMVAYTSIRRIKAWGRLRVIVLHTVNGFLTFFSGKSLKNYPPIR